MNTALLIITGIFGIAIALGVLARRGREMNLEQWSLGGRGFGTVFVFLLMAGEIYTTFTFLGGSGWAYGKGAPAFYIICYGAIGYSVSYLILPSIWRYAKEKRLVSQADYFIAKYDSKSLGVLVSVVSVVALVPYLVLQLKGLGIIVSETSFGRVSQSTAVWTGTAALVGYVVISGVRGSAWTAALKDLMILGVAVGIGIYLPFHYYGGIGPMFRAIAAANPDFFTLPSKGMSSSWLISTVFLTGIGFYMWPHSFASTYTAKSEQIIRKNTIALPLYQLIVLFVMFVGFSAIRVVPGLKGTDADLSLLRISRQTFGTPMLGIIGGAGLLTALVPGSMILISAATILAKNVVHPLRPATDDRRIAALARAFVPLIALVTVILTLKGGTAIVGLLLLGYALVTQLFPALVLSLGERPLVTGAGAVAGILTGELVVAYLTLSSSSIGTLMPWMPQTVKDLNVGTAAMVVNVVVMTIVSLATRSRAPAVAQSLGEAKVATA